MNENSINPTMLPVCLKGSGYRSSATQVLPEDGERIKSPKRCVLKNKQDGVFR
jgi:hypothetical protein